MDDRWKVRAWDKVEKRMMNVFCMNGLDTAIPYAGLVHEKTHCFKYFEEIILMQCTGLKGDDGALIMESDIVEAWDTRCGDDEKVWIRIKVHYLNGCFMFGNWNAHEFMNRFRGRKIIGNIYENLALMEEAHGIER